MTIDKELTAVLFVLEKMENQIEHELVSILEQAGFYINIFKSVMEFSSWKKLSNTKNPDIMITDIPNSAGIFKEIKSFLENSCILVVHNQAKDEKDMNNNNDILGFENFQGVMNFLNDNYLSSIDPDVAAASVEVDFESQSQYDVFGYSGNGNSDNVWLENPKTTDDISYPNSYGVEFLSSTNNDEFKAPIEEVPEPKNDNENQNEDLYVKRSKNLQKKWSRLHNWENHRTIGFWSPLHRMGVTSLTFNFAFFLAKNRIDVAVLEGLSNNHGMKDWLNRYTEAPSNWKSFAKALQTDNIEGFKTNWIYKDVTFLPLDKDDTSFQWNSYSLDSYMRTTDFMDITLVDLPTGKMAPYTLDSLTHINELWIIIDDSIQELLAWKEYIKEIQDVSDISIYLIFNKAYDFSQVKRISREFNFELLVKLPSLHEETMLNYYQNSPMFFQDGIQEKLVKPFSTMATHLIGESFTLLGEDIPPRYSGFLQKILKPLKGH